eukprot:scaffold138055_cov48-Prasinocladus_malaysianus.AAC.1
MYGYSLPASISILQRVVFVDATLLVLLYFAVRERFGVTAFGVRCSVPIAVGIENSGFCLD